MDKNTRKKKILFLITKSNWGGAQRYVYDLATSLPTDQFDVAVAHGGNGEMATKLTAANIRTIPILSLTRDISLKKELFSFSEINRLLTNEQPDIFHVNSSKAGGIGAFLGRLRQVPRVIYTAHGWAFNEERSYISKLVVGFFHWLTIVCAHKTIAVSAATKTQMYWPLTQASITVVHNGRQIPDYAHKSAARAACIAQEPRLAKYKNDIWIGTIGELHPVKRQDIVIKAMQPLHDAGVAARHILIGAGELESDLKALVKANDLDEQVFFTGPIHEAAQYLQAFDIFVLSSRSEALAYVIVEAAQAGLPIVATRVGGIPEIITDSEIGLLVEPNNPTAFTAALQKLISDTNLRQSLGAKAKIRGDHFSLARMVAETCAVYAAR